MSKTAPPAWRPPPVMSSNSGGTISNIHRAKGSSEENSLSVLERMEKSFDFPKRVYNYYMDKTVPWVQSRWAFFGFAILFYLLRVYIVDGFFIVTYALGIYLLNLLIGFLSPSVDPDDLGSGMDGLGDIQLPKSESDEFRPFTRKLPEFQFWFWGARAVVISIFMTFFRVFDLPVFWPILLFYFIFLFFFTMKQQIMHMIKYNYVPWSTGKKGGK